MAVSEDNFDRRVVERKIQEGRVTREEYEAFLAKESKELLEKSLEALSEPMKAQFVRRSGAFEEDSESSSESSESSSDE